MGKLIFGMMQSLDGYVDHGAGRTQLPPPGRALHDHFTDHVRGLAGILYGRRMYEVMRFWDEDHPELDVGYRDFAPVWRAQPKWVASRTIKYSVQTLRLTGLGLIDEYRLYFCPFILGGGKPYFAGARPPLRLTAVDRIGEDAARLTYVPD
jgi:dihydrofolate reductase